VENCVGKTGFLVLPWKQGQAAGTDSISDGVGLLHEKMFEKILARTKMEVIPACTDRIPL